MNQSFNVGRPLLLHTIVNVTPEKGRLEHFYNSIPPLPRNQICYPITTPLLARKFVYASVQGWLVLRSDVKVYTDDKYSLFSPVTEQVIRLPPLLLTAPKGRIISLVAFTLSPDSDSCWVLFFYNNPGLILYCKPAQPNCNWFTQPLEHKGSRLKLSSVVSLNGIIYALATDAASKITSLYEVTVDDSNSLVFKSLGLPIPDLGIYSHYRYYTPYLVESCNHIYLAILPTNFGLDFHRVFIKVYELDLEHKSWREINSLGGRAFFLGSDQSSTWCWGTTDEPERESEPEPEPDTKSWGAIQRNCIYFFICTETTEGIERHLYSYSLHHQSLMDLRSCPNSESPIDFPHWVILPRFISVERRLLENKKNQFCPQEDGQLILKENQNFELSRHKVKQESRSNQLPLDLVELISKYMHLFEYWNFRASSKKFQSVCPAPQWRTNNVTPLFMWIRHNFESCELIDPCRHDSRSSIIKLYPDCFAVQFCNNGWLLTLSSRNSLQFLNIFTGARRDLPQFEVNKFNSIAFSTSPTCSECTTVGIANRGDGSMQIYYLRYGDKTWNQFKDAAISFRVGGYSPIFVAGAFYFLNTNGYLGVFQLLNGKPSWKTYNAKPLTLKQVDSKYLVECSGEVYAVFVEKVGKFVQVFRFDDLSKKWFEVNCLENYCLFISSSSSFSIVTTDPNLRNRIYFPRLRRKGVVFYSLDTHKYHVLDSVDFMEDLYGTSEPSRCCWI